MRCVGFAAAKAQSFFSREIVATNRRVRLKSAALNRPDNTVTPCDAARPWLVTVSSLREKQKVKRIYFILEGQFRQLLRARGADERNYR